MLKPHEMRARAAQLRAEAQAIYDAKKDTEADFSEEELRTYDAKLEEAAGLLTKAAEVEAREKRMNDLDAKLAQAPGRTSDPLPHQDQTNTRDGRLGYSLLKAIRQANPAEKRDQLDGIELEVHEELAKRHNRPARGVLVPWDLPVDVKLARRYAQAQGIERRDLTTVAGAGAVYETVSPTMIELLRNMMLANRLGVRTMADMEGNFSLPKQTGTGTAYWVTEGNAPTESNQTIGSVDFSPSTVGAFTDYSRKFLLQTSIDAEQFVREDLTRVVAIEMDRVTFNGSGVGAEPEGIIVNTGVPVIALGANGGAPTWAALVQMESEVAIDNALAGQTAYVTTPAGRGKLKTTTQVTASTFAQWLWAADNTVNGYPTYASNQIPGNLSKGTAVGVLSAVVFGNFADAVWALWSGLDILVDPYSGGTAGNVRIVTLQDADFQLRRTESFSVIKDMSTAP